MGFLEGNAPFADQLQNAISDISYTHSNVEYVFICGGRNDGPIVLETPDDEKTEVLSVFATAISNYPNAKVIFIPMLWDASLFQQQQYRAYRLFSQCCIGQKVTMIPNAYMWLMGYKDYILSDGVHPNIAGHAAIFNHIADALETGFSYQYTNSVTLSRVSNNVDSSNTPFVAILNEEGRLSFNAKFTITNNTSRWETLFTYTSTDGNNPFIFSQYGQSIPVIKPSTNEMNMIILSITNSNGTYTINANVNGVVMTPGEWVSLETSIPFGLVNFAHVE